MDAHFNQTYSTEMLPHLNTKIHLIKHMIPFADMGGIFIVLSAGIFLAVISLGFEHWYYKRKTPSRVQSAVVKVSEIENDAKKKF